MTITLEIPGDVFRRAKAIAAQRGIPLRQLVTEAIEEKLRAISPQNPWIVLAGKLRHLKKETARINQLIETG